MLNRFNSTVYWNTTDQITTATTNILIPPVDISSYETFSLLFQNQNTSINMINVVVQVAQDPSANIGATGHLTGSRLIPQLFRSQAVPQP